MTVGLQRRAAGGMDEIKQGQRQTWSAGDYTEIGPRGHSPDAWVDHYATCHGPVVRAFEAVGPEGREALRRDLLATVEAFNVSGYQTVLSKMDYLEVVIRTTPAP